MEKALLISHQHIFSIIFDCLGNVNFDECSKSRNNKKDAFSIFYDMIYLFTGEPSQLLQV